MFFKLKFYSCVVLPAERLYPLGQLLGIVDLLAKSLLHLYMRIKYLLVTTL